MQGGIGQQYDIGMSQQGSIGMGLNPQAQSGSGMGMNQGAGSWSYGIQPQQPSGLGVGGAQQPLIASPVGVAIQRGGTDSNKPAPGANPFADLLS
jgi:hypothetical protein